MKILATREKKLLELAILTLFLASFKIFILLCLPLFSIAVDEVKLSFFLEDLLCFIANTNWLLLKILLPKVAANR